MRALRWRASSSRMALLKCMLEEFTGDNAQSLQLATSAQRIIQAEETKTVESLNMDYDAVLVKVKNDTHLGVRFSKGALTSVGYESALLELNGIV